MELGEFKGYIQTLPSGTKFEYSLSDPFSWRGDYSEVAFSISYTPSSREDILVKIESALTNEFSGYTGEKYRFRNHTKINFEENIRNLTDGGYAEDWLAELTDIGREERLIKLIFNNK